MLVSEFHYEQIGHIVRWRTYIQIIITFSLKTYEFNRIIYKYALKCILSIFAVRCISHANNNCVPLFIVFYALFRYDLSIIRLFAFSITIHRIYLFGK